MITILPPRGRTGPSLPLLFLVLACSGLLLAAGPRQTAVTQDALSADAMPAQVVDREGVAARKPVGAQRWQPAEQHTRLAPGDWLKTGTRGANALEFRLEEGSTCLMGPGALVELVDQGRVHLVRGELEVKAGAQGLVVEGPAGSSQAVEGRRVLRARDRELTTLAEDPRWLAGYRQHSSTEALGSLLANVDGRNVPLTIGYHKVTVDLRDQIARTTVEESFVNHTSAVLEGVFYFPLPADASISGFGMWIGDELVHGDIVEKQRAREIYETILREKRDPGLLEWSGGNVFKARVYPIGAEKRIRITYTQVLPKKGDTYSYHYSLQSELLRQNPLERLQLTVTVQSTEALAAVTSPSHDCRIRSTDHSAQVEFEAEEFMPTRDFELRVQVAPGQGGLTVIPHRRGDDGYFMALLDAPEAVHAPSDVGVTLPLDLVLIADTSGSMEGPPRAAQVAFLEALLGALGPEDRFQLMTCDVQARWAFDEAVAPDPEHVEGALAFLEARPALGWSDLEVGFQEAMARARPETQVVYVGDGMVTVGDADPDAFARRLQRLYPGRGTFHAVVPGSTSEMVVLRTLAGFGGGSVRSTGAADQASTAAFDLLQEIGGPSLRDLTLSFEGMGVAAVYPEVLPNLPVGTQQIVLGRYDPTMGAVRGKVRMQGTLDGRPVTMTADVILDEAERGNSFLPRLWARRHLDHLLQQGGTAEVRERIIGLSEDFQIITPYTSFLVLESEADRERFRVQKQFRMRDGEEFFAAGRDAATTELLRQQLVKARGWRMGLRRQMLEDLADLYRSLTETLAQDAPSFQTTLALGEVRNGFLERGGLAGSTSRGPTGGGLDSFAADSREYKDLQGLEEGDKGDASGVDFDEDFGEDLDEKAQAAEEMDELAPSAKEALNLRGNSPSSPGPVRLDLRQAAAKRMLLPADLPSTYAWAGRRELEALGYLSQPSLGVLPHVFPTVPDPTPVPPPEWSPEVRALVGGLDRRLTIAQQSAVLRIATTYSSEDHRGRPRAPSAGELLAGADAWLQVSTHVDGHGWHLAWVGADRRTQLQSGWWVGSSRARKDGDEDHYLEPFSWYFGLDAYHLYEAEMRPGEAGLTELLLRHESRPDQHLRLVIDAERHAVLEACWVVRGEQQGCTRFHDLRQVAGAWWPTRVTVTDAKGRETSRIHVVVEELAAQALADRQAEARVQAERGITLGALPEQIADARQAVKEGRDRFEDQWVILLHESAAGRWAAAEKPYQALLERAGDKAGMLKIRLAWLSLARRNEEMKGLVMAAAAELARTPDPSEVFLYGELLHLASALHPGQERRALLDALHPVVARQTAQPELQYSWEQQVVATLQNMGRTEEAFASQRAMAERHPTQADAHTTWAGALAGRGEVDRALAWLDRAEREQGPWQEHELKSFRTTQGWILWNHYRLGEFVDLAESWNRASPETLDTSVFSQHLSALIFLGRDAEAMRLLESWLFVDLDDPLTEVEKRRLHAAVDHALGQGYGQYRYSGRFQDEELERMARAGLRLLDQDELAAHAGRILQHRALRDSDVGQELLARVFARARDEAGTLPAARLAHFVTWVQGAGYTKDDIEPEWRGIFETVDRRSQEVDEASDRLLLEQVVLQHGPRDLQLGIHRRRLARAATPIEKGTAAQALFQELLQEEWSAEVQSEMVALLDLLHSPAPEEWTDAERDAFAEQDLLRRILAAYQLTDWMVDQGTEVRVRRVPDFTTLSRRQLRDARHLARGEAQEAARAVLAGLEESAAADLRDWLVLDRVYLQVQRRKDLDQAWAVAQGLLDRLQRQYAATDEKTPVPLRVQVAASRALATLLYLVSQEPEGGPGARESALRARLEQAIAGEDRLMDWRRALYVLLVTRDRGDDVEAVLKDWYAGGEQYDKLRYGRDHAWIQAERGRLPEAIRVMEEIDRIESLTAKDFEALATWYLILGQDEEHRQARIRGYAVQPEWELSNRLYQQLGDYQRTGPDVPSELDPAIPLQLTALLRHASWPANHLSLVRSYYLAIRDFRLLECVPEAVLGHTSQRIYPFLAPLSQLTEALDEEATADRLVQHLRALHERAETDTNRRALRLLEFMVERRPAAQSQGQVDHVAAARAALEAALDGEWEEGEHRLLAEYLAAQGALKDPGLAALQRDHLQRLQSMVKPGGEDRMAVVGHRAELLWQYQLGAEAIRVLQAGIQEYRKGDEPLPQSARGHLSALARYQAGVGAYAAAEQTWQDELRRDASVAGSRWLTVQLLDLYRQAVREGGEVSLGKDQDLYRAAQARLLQELERPTDPQHARNLVTVLCQMFREAVETRKWEEPKEDAVRFAFQVLPRVLGSYQYREGQTLVQIVLHCLEAVRGPAKAVEFLVVRAETEPAWLRLQNQDFWQRFGWTVAEMRARARGLDRDLERRLLDLVLVELRDDLWSRVSRARAIYHNDHGYFWQEKLPDFRRVALQVLEDKDHQEATGLYVADYLFEGLNQFDDAIAALFVVHRRGALGLGGQSTLCDYLQKRSRWQETLPMLRGLVERQPDRMLHRTMLMRSLYHTGQEDQLKAALAATDAHFRAEDSRWTEDDIASLARACVETLCMEEGIGYFEEAIALHVRTAPNRGVGDGVLSEYYRVVAEAWSGLGETSKAVDAAAGAIVSWGSHEDGRSRALQRLQQVLAGSRDLDAYVRELDGISAETGLENPIVRKALGAVYLQRKEYPKAIAQLRLAVAQQPDDRETHQLLVSALDQAGRPEQAVAQLLASLGLSGHDPVLYRDLGRRLQRLEREEEAERVHTNLVEARPHESESHQALAGVRQEQGRWADAEVQWRQVIRIRTREPQGYLGLARVLLHLGRREEAAAVVDQILHTEWPEHFGDVHGQAREILGG